ncbi:GerMN domain-containing protein [Microbacterium sp. P07]|uniref:GerMN domain-containing protein n=1 Tax=Microbacterium sp. P07 TaxID=3366952 RepID=UPI0037461C38
MKRAATAVLAGMLLFLTACTGLPTSGPVNAGNLPKDADDTQTFDLVPDPPQAGASPEQIVDGFLRAGVGAQDDWQTAREYLTPEYAPEWQPLASVTIDRLSERSAAPASPAPSPSPTTEASSIEITQRVTAEAYVSPAGEYVPAYGAPVSLPFRLVQRDGEWRIDLAPDGIVLYQEVFPSVFRSASVMYFDKTWTYLVPDVRWFPGNLIAARVAQALVDGPPSQWLDPAVATAFPDDVTLASSAVPLIDGGTTAQVELSTAAFSLDERTLNRMQTQLEQSLASVGVAEAQMTVGTTPLGAEAVPFRSTRVKSDPLVEIAGDGFGFLVADSIETIPGLSRAVEEIDAASVEVTADHRSAAVLNGSGAVLRAYADETFEVLDGSTPDLVAPSIDTQATVWSASRSDPDAFAVYPLEGDPAVITALWPSVSQLYAFQLSRDGTRLAALVRANDRTEVWVAAVSRDGGTPVAVGEPLVLATTPSEGVDLAWLDDGNLGVLLNSAQGSTVLLQPVGGRGTLLAVSSGAVDIAGGNSTVRLRTSEGALLIQRGANWEEGAADIAVLGVQQGLPE